MSGDRADFALATGEIMEAAILEQKFVYTFVEYTHVWSDASSDMDPVLIEVRAAAAEFKECLQRAHVEVSLGHPSKVFLVLRSLDERAASVKTLIREAYQQCALLLSTGSFRPCPPTAAAGAHDWCCFCSHLSSILQGLSEEVGMGSSLRMQMKCLERSLKAQYWLLLSGAAKQSSWKEKMMVHFGGMVIRAAHMCCWFWYCYGYTARSSPDLCREMEDSLLVLCREMDPDAPEFLEISLRFLDGREVRDSEASITSFLCYVVGLVERNEILRKELAFLLTFVLNFSEMHNMEDVYVSIKDILMGARFLEYSSCYCFDYAILLATIWCLKIDIFVRSGGSLIKLCMDDHVKALRDGSAFLDRFCSTDKIFLFMEAVESKVQSFCHLPSPEMHKEDYLLLHNKVSNLLFKFQVLNKVLKAELQLSELLNNHASLICVVERNAVAIVVEGLLFVVDIMIDKVEEREEREELMLIDTEVMADEVMSYCSSLLSNNIIKGQVKNMDVSLYGLWKKVEHLKMELKLLYFQVPRFDHPKIPRLCFIKLLLHKLRDLLNCKHGSTGYKTHQLIYRDLEFIVSKFQDGFEKQECENLLSRLAVVAYQVEFVIDLMSSEQVTNTVLLWFYHLSGEMRQIKRQLIDFDGNKKCAIGVDSGCEIPMISKVSYGTIEDVMVGLDDHKQGIIERLTRGTAHRDVVSLVGMAGIGKTTLANNVFCSPDVLFHFHVRAWCRVSQNHRKRDLLLDLLSYIITVIDNTHAMSDADLEELLYKRLKGKRYLIIMDDIWSCTAWDELQFCFPDDSNGSRVFLTSRLVDVVSKISDPHPLRPLSEEESWQLLKLKIFKKEECPEELSEVGQKIANNCKGLPLAIGAIAGLLYRTAKNQAAWRQIAESVTSRIVNDPEMQCKEILELSYRHLPDHLKACFLYLAVYPEEKDISVEKLQWLWIAEGFVHEFESKGIEDVAEEYVMDLIARSLVMVVKRRSNGKVKTCRMHDVVRDLCLLKAKEDSFFLLISAKDEPYSSFDVLDDDVYLNLCDPSDYVVYHEYRLCFCVSREQFVASEPSGPFVRSLLHIATTDMYPRCPYDLAFISKGFQRLRVLDLEFINMGYSLAKEIELLFDLKYLAVCGDMESIPESIANLRNLVTLVIKSLKKKVVLPDTIWKMEKLRHVHVTRRALFTLQFTGYGRSCQLLNLVSLSFACFACVESTNDAITRFPNLKKLKCIVFEPQDVPSNLYRFPALGSLSKLESLKMSYYGKVLNAAKLIFPTSIKKLTLSNFRLPWTRISAIGRLPYLEVLKLISKAFEGPSWNMAENEFVCLKYLRLDSLDIVDWNASSDHLPRLQQLVVRNCNQLEEIPFDFTCISTLQSIEVQQCGISVEESVQRIEEEGIEGLKIVINNIQ